MALGAERQGLVRLVLGQGMRASLVGLALGMVAALASTRVLTGFLFEVQPNDPVALGGVALVLVLVSALACVLPARRATAVDPVEVLRAE
jgi:putative ABC transport system permease protein